MTGDLVAILASLAIATGILIFKTIQENQKKINKFLKSFRKELIKFQKFMKGIKRKLFELI